MSKTLNKKHTFRDGRKGFVHIIRDTINRKKTRKKFTYKNVSDWLGEFYPEKKIRRNTLVHTLWLMVELDELEVIELGRGCIATVYKKKKNNGKRIKKTS